MENPMSANANLIHPTFRVNTALNEARSKKMGRPVFDEMEVIEIRFAGDKQKVAVFPAHEVDPEATRENNNQPVTYAQRYNKQYLDFKNQTTQSLSGTPLEELPFLTQSRRRELKALNIHTAEALAALDGNPLRQIGHGGRELKNQAQAYLDNAAKSVDVVSLAAQVAALQQQLEERDAAIARFRADPAAAAPVSTDADGDDPEDEDEEQDDDAGEEQGEKRLEDCTDAELKAFIKRETGEPVKGNPSRQTLIERAMEIATQPEA
jgi:ribosomal protein L12E/L44/L45/RPP1/RPP2